MTDSTATRNPDPAAEARVAALLEAAAAEDDTALRKLLAADAAVAAGFDRIEATLKAYGRTEVPALSRLYARELLKLVEDLTVRSVHLIARETTPERIP